MFSLNQSDEIVFQIYPPNNIPQQQDQEDALIIQHADLTHHQAATNYGFVPRTTTTTNSGSPIKRQRNKPPLLNTGHDNNNNDNNNNNNNINIDQSSGKKVMHRETERLRRQEMGKLYESLRNQIPVEFIKGKRSISDHMHQAVNYINHLQRNIKELDIKRNGLKKSSHVISHSSNNTIGMGNTDPNGNSNTHHHVTVTSCWYGAEIFITSGLAEEGLQLSQVMQLLVEQGLNVISYASTRANQRLRHTIQCEASDPTSVDISGLQQKLKDVLMLNLK